MSLVAHGHLVIVKLLYSGISLAGSHLPPSLAAHKVVHPGGRRFCVTKTSLCRFCFMNCKIYKQSNS